jgi:hypothetical protein
MVFVLLPGVLVPARFWPAEILLGPWLLIGIPARLVSLLLAAVHAACAWGWWSARPWVVSLSLWLNGGLVISVWSAALWTDPEILTTLGVNILSPGALRVLLVLAGALGCTLLLAIHLAGRTMRRAASL